MECLVTTDYERVDARRRSRHKLRVLSMERLDIAPLAIDFSCSKIDACLCVAELDHTACLRREYFVRIGVVRVAGINQESVYSFGERRVAVSDLLPSTFLKSDLPVVRLELNDERAITLSVHAPRSALTLGGLKALSGPAACQRIVATD